MRRFIENEMAASRFNYFAPWLAFGDLTLAETLCPVELFAENVMPAFAGLKKAGDEFLRTLGLLTL